MLSVVMNPRSNTPERKLLMPPSLPEPPETSDRHARLLTDEDIRLFQQGIHLRLYEKLGAHPVMHAGVSRAPSPASATSIASCRRIRTPGRRRPIPLRSTAKCRLRAPRSFGNWITTGAIAAGCDSGPATM